jgi:hypothetical protein
MFNTQIIPRTDRSRMESIIARIKLRKQKEAAREKARETKKKDS